VYLYYSSQSIAKMTKHQHNCNRKCCTVLTPENHTLFKNYENRLFEAFSHVSVVNDNYMILFKRILKKLRMPKFLESLIEFKINIIKMVIPRMSV
jgi:hypothetical protein